MSLMLALPLVHRLEAETAILSSTWSPPHQTACHKVLSTVHSQFAVSFWGRHYWRIMASKILKPVSALLLQMMASCRISSLGASLSVFKHLIVVSVVGCNVWSTPHDWWLWVIRNKGFAVKELYFCWHTVIWNEQSKRKVVDKRKKGEGRAGVSP